MASALVVAGCSTLRRSSELDVAINNLQDVLDDLANTDSEQIRLISLARRIEIRALDLVSEHQEFIESFDSLLIEREVSEQELLDRVDTFDVRREWLRNDLLKLQDELHYSLTPAEWQEVVQVLNQTSTVAISRTIEGA